MLPARTQDKPAQESSSLARTETMEDQSLSDRSQMTLATNNNTEGPPAHIISKASVALPPVTTTADADIDIELSTLGQDDGNHLYEVQWEGGDADPLNPRSFSTFRKWVIYNIVCSSALCVTFASSVYASTYGQLMPEFGISRLVATVGLSLYIIGLAFGPLMLAPLSEFYGRRKIYLTSFTFFLIWLVPEAAAQNIATMLVGRLLCGLSGSAFLAVAGGTAGDLFARNQLQAPMVMFTAATMVGPSVGPVVGGFINQYASWRWTFYLLIIWSAIDLVLLTFFVPETYHPTLLRDKARKLRADTGDGRWFASIEKTKKSIPRTVAIATRRPFEMLIFDPMCLNLCILSALLLGIVYLFFGAFGVVFVGNYGFSLSELGLTFLGLFAGVIMGAVCQPWVYKDYLRRNKRREELTGEIGVSEPEYRLPPAIAGAVLVPVGLFIFAWTCFPNIHWIVPIIGSAIFSMGCLFVFSGVQTFQVDAYPLYAASALGANTFARCSFGAIFPLFGVQMYERLGDHWATSILAFLTLAMMPFPYIFYRYGKRIRARSRFASA
ncbi:major facilitator superfamily domain-containing protein [Rhypophila decipiens]|uniref:Major facilitator superfamily domain-containing protein n=1 Tax=Rhypophila decipiens TaxID=261697 RepID=A0AAN6Y422_9PEZI|nr:major facilitator superfamily domain-containing protein [Rhypophila decipiens]